MSSDSADKLTGLPDGGDEKSIWDKVQVYFNTINHIVIGIISIYMSFICYRAGGTMYNWHAWLCTIGYQLLMTEAIMAFYSANSWSQFHSSQTKTRLHWILMSIGSVFALGGMIVEYIFRETTDRPHLSSTHALFGLISFIFTSIGVINGTATLWSAKFRKYIRPLILKCFHNSIGTIAFVTGMITLYYGFDKNLLKRQSDEVVRLWLQVGSIFTIILSLIGAFRAGFMRYKSLFF